MNNHSCARLTTLGALFSAALGGSGLAWAEADSPHSISANIGVVSNYMWRGVTQTLDDPAVQGGLDYAHVSGFYLGTWASNIDWGGEDPNYELDFYGGYGGAVNEAFSYDLKLAYYAYPDGRDSDFAEVSASGTFYGFTLGLAYTLSGENDGGLFDDDDLYYYASFDYDALPYGLAFNLRAGYYDFRHDTVLLNNGWESESADYWHYGASLSKDAGDFGTFSLNWDQNDGDPDSPGGYDNDPKIWVGWLKEF